MIICLIYSSFIFFVVNDLFSFYPTLTLSLMRRKQSFRYSLIVLSADTVCKQLGTRSGPTFCRAWSGSKLFDTLMVFPNEFFEKKKNDFEKNQQTTKTCTSTQNANSKAAPDNVLESLLIQELSSRCLPLAVGYLDCIFESLRWLQ